MFGVNGIGGFGFNNPAFEMHIIKSNMDAEDRPSFERSLIASSNYADDIIALIENGVRCGLGVEKATIAAVRNVGCDYEDLTENDRNRINRVIEAITDASRNMKRGDEY
jgi:hypothetical protein